MNKYIYFLIIIFALVLANNAMAAIIRPLAGQILVSPVSGVTCPSSTTPGQFTVKPYTIASPGPYLILFSGTKRIPRPGAYFKGNYLATPLPLCNAGTSSVPTLMIIPFIYQATQ